MALYDRAIFQQWGEDRKTKVGQEPNSIKMAQKSTVFNFELRFSFGFRHSGFGFLGCLGPEHISATYGVFSPFP